MKGLVKDINYESLTICIACKEIKKDIYYKFNSIESLYSVDDKFIVEFDMKVSNGQISVKKPQFDKFIVNDIVVDEIVGSGDNAVVYKGCDNFFERNVAVKVWIPNYKDGKRKSNKTRFKEEIKKMAQVNEIAVTTLYSRGTINEFDFVVMELVEGVTLRKWMQYRHNYYERYTILREILETIENVHKKNIYHGDLHDSNILITEGIRLDSELHKQKEFKVSIIDFGTSKFSGRVKSHIRESKYLSKTSFQLIPEIIDHKLLAISDFSYIPPKLVPLIIRSACQIVIIEKNQYVSEQAVNDIALLISIAPFFNSSSVEKIIRKYSDTDKIEKNVDLFVKRVSEYIYNFHNLICEEGDRFKEIHNLKVMDLYNTLRKRVVEIFNKDIYNDKLLMIDHYFNYKELVYSDLYGML